MHSVYSRCGKLFYWACFNLAIAATVLHLSWYLPANQRRADAALTIHAPTRFFAFARNHPDLHWDQAESAFDLELRRMDRLEHWAVKQLFIYVQASWIEGGKRNEAIVWDRIVPRADIADISLFRERFKYPLTDRHQRLRGKTVTFRVWIETIPVFGWINRVFLKALIRRYSDSLRAKLFRLNRSNANKKLTLSLPKPLKLLQFRQKRFGGVAKARVFRL